ncbi:MAG: bacillithiol biosynthesis cysteine-adding enzyme BshC [Acidobacteriota bacterium]|nr:bacillithiol biosynthesis cysteine-adding enzyme BshC [Pyrinomonadaceae bacterium]MDW8303246.1 bacillithiol biosynthesis cysteine-adding enzyme BshC [Acidobacteriota bacterium]
METQCLSEENLFRELFVDVDFSKIPSQSKIFIEYQKGSDELGKFYPSAIFSHTEVLKNLNSVLESYSVDREKLCNALQKDNLAYGAGVETLSNIELLRQSDCVAVVTGQQAGLFTGPLYCIYKTLTAIKLAECLKLRGVKAVPVFWMATEDHDFAEVASCYVVNSKRELIRLTNEPRDCYNELPVGLVSLDDSINQTKKQLFQSIAETDFSAELRRLIEETWQPGFRYSEAFARMMMRLFGKYGLVLLCPLNKDLKNLASPIYLQAVEKSDELIKALLLRSKKLTLEGFHAQVSITENYFLLFWHSEDGRRHALRRVGSDLYQTKNAEKSFTRQELLELIRKEPESFSPSVVLRPVVQDFLLPTICYFGGAAEIAYFAQVSEVYRVLKRPVTPIIHRQSFTIIPSKQAKIMRKYGLTFEDLFLGKDKVFSSIIENQILSDDQKRLFAEVEENINAELNRLDRYFSQIDSTLAENLAKRRRKIIYHIAALRDKFLKIQKQKNETVMRHVENLFSVVLPFERLQERTLNISFFLNIYGQRFIDKIYSAIELDNKKHRVIFSN